MNYFPIFNSFSLQIQVILSFDKYVLASVEIPIFTDSNYTFLREFQSIMRPISEGLTFLEGDRQTFDAYAPMFFGIQAEFKRLEMIDFVFARPLLDAVMSGFGERFDHLLDPFNEKSIPIFLAMLSNPKYKLNYLPPSALSSEQFAKLKNVIVKEAGAINEIRTGHNSEKESEREASNRFNSVESVVNGMCCVLCVPKFFQLNPLFNSQNHCFVYIAMIIFLIMNLITNKPLHMKFQDF